ncbi:helix-turn-helix domain-containing protein [Microbacterium hominis]|uniref:helix-turn-helix domain-containing protein n=1 Tax=Microbacterium hominis TaxID=162426 RepID=UPI0009DE13C2
MIDLPGLPTVDIVYLCSNKSTTSVTAAQIRAISDAGGGSERTFQPRVKRGWNRLNADQHAAVVTRYRNGETSTALAEEYGVAKSTILRILRDKNVMVRRQPLTPEQVSEAAHFYEDGLSLSQVATQLGVNQETMRVAIIKAGVALREPTKAKQA